MNSEPKRSDEAEIKRQYGKLHATVLFQDGKEKMIEPYFAPTITEEK